MTLVPPSLEETVLSDYPTPIALTYRRYLDSRFNPHERVLRLKDLFESVSFFVYHLVLADALNRLDGERYFVADKGARKAYNGYSMSARMDFVKHLLQHARANNGDDLFVPELLNTSVAEHASHLQEALRNPVSHTATAPESRLKKLVDQFEPEITEMLNELRFLVDYRMVRITSFYYRGGKFVRRMEVYRGSVPSIDEQELSEGATLTRADYDHLVLLDQDDQVLDLYPLYQLLANEDTRYENHMCFLKQRKAGERILEGESVQGAFSTHLEGFDQFDLLLRKFSD